ncbi:hypothetical protein LTS18_013386, partial [Coniosporium uncinatum]
MSEQANKRAVYTIDLTGSDDDVQITSSRPTKTPRLANKHITPRDSGYFGAEAEEEESEDVIDLSQDRNDRSIQNYVLYGMLHLIGSPHFELSYLQLLAGTLQTKVVGVRYYNGYASIGEMVVLNREPHNQYDRNAIQVQNVQRDQIGHIPRTVAVKLAKFMDGGSLRVEGILVGHLSYYEGPIALKLFGSNDPTERMRLTEQMKAEKLPVDEFKRREKEE